MADARVTPGRMLPSSEGVMISPVGELNWDGRVIVINNGKIGKISQMLYDAITGIQWGEKPDAFQWTLEV